MAIYIYERDLYSYNKTVNQRRSSVQHYHEHNELYYLLNGSTTYYIEDKAFKVSKGDFVFIPKTVLHSTDSGECLNTERILITFDDKSLDEQILPILKVLGEQNIIHIAKGKTGRMEELLHLVKEEYENTNEYRDFIVRLYVSELLVLINRCMIDSQSQNADKNGLLQTVSEYIAGNYGSDISLSSLAKQFFVSKSYLSRRFKAHFGIGLNEYIRSVRIKKAADMLADSDMKITEIATKCGFNDSNYFSSVFKKEKGVTPHKYSKMYGHRNVI